MASSSTAPVICIICAEKLHTTQSSALTCGHVFHRGCIENWLCEKSSCPNCRTCISNRDRVDRLYFDTDDYPAESEEENPPKEKEKPWYEDLGLPLAFAAGAVTTALGIWAVSSATNSKKKEEQKK